jgi:hypothetical protein
MSTATSETNAARSRYLFYKKHPEVAPVKANDLEFQGFADANGLSLETPSTWETAFAELSALGKLAENTRSKIAVEKPEPVAEGAAPVAEENEQTRLRRIRKAIHYGTPEQVFAASDELRRITSGPQKDGETDFQYFGRLYPKVSLERMGQTELHQVMARYGSRQVTSVLNSN